MSKWVEAIAQLNNERKSVTAFLKKNMLSRFDTPRAIISDGGSHFCKKIVQGLLEKYVLVTMWLLLTTYKLAEKWRCPIGRSNNFLQKTSMPIERIGQGC